MSERIYDELLRTLISTENGEEYIRNYVEFPGVDGHPIKMTFEQVKHFAEVMLGDSPMFTRMSPIEFVLISYDLKEEFKEGWALTSYRLDYNNEKRTITLDGVMEHPMTIEGMPGYVEGATVPVQRFNHVIENVSLYGNLALVNCIAALAPEFEMIRGAYGGSFILQYANKGFSLNSY